LSPDKLTATTETPTLPAAPRFKLLSSTVADLTPEELAKFLAIESGVLERDLSKKRVAHLREKALAGLLVTFHWVLVTILSTGKIVRGNGFHSSTMLTTFGANLPPGLKVHLEHYEVKDGDGFAELFQQFDDRASARQAADVAGVYQSLQPGLHDVPKRVGKIGIDGYVWFRRYVQGAGGRLGDMAYSTFSDEGLHPFLHWMAAVLANAKGTKELNARPVAGAMFATFEANESAAKLFWETVASGGDPDQPDLPETALSQWLVTMSSGKAEKVSPQEYYQGCIYCWNQFRADKRVGNVRYAVKTNPLNPSE